MESDRTFYLICLPHAGGSKYSYNKFRTYLGEEITLVSLELPGRGGRIAEPLLDDLTSILKDLQRQILTYIDQGPYLLYGHSMGGILGHELIHFLIENEKKTPELFLVTGCVAPQFRRPKHNLHHLNDWEFKAKLKKLGGVPEEVLVNDELMDFLLPALRADVTALDNYKYLLREKHEVPIVAIAGTKEDMEENELAGWQLETKAGFSSNRYTGSHFFILEHFDKLAQIVKGKFKEAITPLSD